MTSPASPSSRHTQRSVVALFLVFGLLLLGMSLKLTRNASALQAGVHTEGTIVGLVSRRGLDQSLSAEMAPVVGFLDASGTLVRFTNALASGPASVPIPGTGVRVSQGRPTVGATVRVRSPPGQPSQARIDDFESLWLFPLLSLGAGGLVTAAGILGALGRWKATVRES